MYLAGPITGCNEGEAKDWRQYVSGELKKHFITGISPLRCEPIIGERYDVGHLDPKFGTARAISSKNLADVKWCDMTLAYFPAHLNQRKVSLGTVCELAWASALGKPVVLVTDDENMVKHPVINACAGWLVSTLDEGIEILTGVLGDYARPLL